jgi:U3 small nucleolar RNA-associated protein 25
VNRDDPVHGDLPSEDDGFAGQEEEDIGEQDIAQSNSEGEDEAPAPNSYLTLLHSLNSRKDSSEPPRKKRKAEPASHSNKSSTETRGVAGNLHAEVEEADLQEQDDEVQQDLEEDERLGDALDGDVDSEDEEHILSDPFEQHYAAMTEQVVKDSASQVEAKDWQIQSSISESEIRRTQFSRKGTNSKNRVVKSVNDLSLKQRLIEPGTKAASTLSTDQKVVASDIFNYNDVIYGCRNLENAAQLRDMSCLHALNQVFKTRDRVLKNNTKLSTQTGSEVLDLRDQGFTRPKVLIILPTKQACVRFVDSIVKLSEPDQQENKARFLETFSHEDKDEWPNKPEDFRELFGGNHEEDFRIGLKFTRKTIKYFSGFYNSDIIIGSPLGLMRTITTGGGGKDKKKTHDADFLSSIELLIVDHANALQMQNWQHVDFVFSQLNLLPKDSHGCDFSRVRHWYLDGQAKYLRQTVIFSDYITPEINALASTHLHNISGRVKFQPTYPGVMLSVSALLPSAIPQTFLRFPSPTALQDSDARFKIFTTTILPPILRDPKHQKGILLFVPVYLDFVRLRNYLSTSADATNLSFGSISEYTPKKDVLRARSHFLNGRHSLLLYTERAHHHFRYRLKGVKKIVFYGVAENPIFWNELVSLLGLTTEKTKTGSAKGTIRALFSKWDALKLERVVGTERVGRLINDRGGDVFDFV